MVQEIPIPYNTRAYYIYTVGILFFFFILLLLSNHFHFADKDSFAKGRINKIRHILSLLHLCLSINCQRYRGKSTKVCKEAVRPRPNETGAQKLDVREDIIQNDTKPAQYGEVNIKVTNKR